MISAALIGMVLIAGPSTPLAGTVVAEDGTAVVGAELVLTSPTSPAPTPATRPADLASPNRLLVPTLWTVAPGRRVSVLRFAGGMPGAGEPVRVVLGPPAGTEVRVEAPDGAPLAGARVNVQRIKSEPLPVPDPVADLTERTTGPDGVAVLDAFGPEDVGHVDVIARGYGIQPRWIDPDAQGPKRVALRAVVALKGRLAPDDEVGPAAVQGWRVRAWTRDTAGDGRTSTMAGYDATTTDDEGRFTLPELAPGALSLAVIPPDGSDLLPDLTRVPPLREGRENALEIAVRRSTTIDGVAREQGTGKPVAGMRVTLFRPGGSGTVYGATDAEGRYSFRSLAGKARVWAPESPPGYVSMPGVFSRDVEVPQGPGRVAVAAFELVRAAPPLRGEVRDEAGRPVVGAEIDARWTLATPGGNASHSSTTTSDARGGFALEGLAPGSRVTIDARHHDRATARPVQADAGSDAPLVVAIAPKPVVAVTGRVLGPGGAPVAGAAVTIRGRETAPGRPSFGNPVRLQGNPAIRTGPDGTFRTPGELDRDGREYQAEVVVAGYHPERTAWSPTGDGGVLTLPDLRLRRARATRAVPGRVVDRAGRPLAGASVFQAGDGPARTEAATDDAGRFRLAGVYDGPTLVFAEAAGFRFGGAVLGAEAEAVEVRLDREAEPPIAHLETLPSPMGRAEERALARELLAPVLAEARSGAIGHVGRRVIPTLARVDPDRVQAMLEDRVLDRPATGTVYVQSLTVLDALALARFEDDPREAIATLEADLEPGPRARGFLALADAVPAADRARRGELLDRAHAEARRAGSPEAKIQLLGEIADRWLDLGDVDRARPILLEGRAAVAALAKDTFVFQAETFAEVLAAIDLPAAREIFERKGLMRVSAPDDATIRRHLAAAAVRIAALDPAEAERLSGLASGGPNIGDRENMLLRIARKMARADLPRARKLLVTIAERPDHPSFARPALVPYGLGLFASDLAAADPARARGLLDEAFAGLLKIARDTGGRMSPPGSLAMAALLPTVERVDPDRLAERLWLAASCRPPLAQEPNSGDVLTLATLASLAARYHKAMADAIAAPALERLPSLLDRTDGRVFQDDRVFDALTAYDPRAIDSLIGALPASARRTERTRNGGLSVAPEAVARLAAAEMLGLPIEDRRRTALRRAGFVLLELPEVP